jgi:hypothetical protein
MKKLILLLIAFSLYTTGYSQLPAPKKIDSIVKLIESKKDLVLKAISDTFPTANPKIVMIESVKFYSSKNKLVKVAFSGYYHRKDSVMNNIITDNDVYYFNDDVMIKVISKDYDQSPPKDLQLYLNEKHLKKYQAKETQFADKFDGVNYFIELGYNLLGEFRYLNKTK